MRRSKNSKTKTALRRGSGAVTMETIGRLAGVSQVTVSRALNHPGTVSAEKLRRINEAISVTGYVPDLAAAGLAARRTHLIAAFVPSITNIVYSTLIQSFIGSIRAAKYHVLLGETGFSKEEEHALVANLLRRKPDGLLLTGIHHSSECRRLLLSAKIPVVEVWDITETPIDTCVGFSHAKTGEAVAAFVEERGYKRAAAVSAGDERALRRKDAFVKALQERGFSGTREICLKDAASISRGRKALAQLIDDEGFSNGAIFCSSDLLAHGILIEAQARGIKVPGEIAVIGFGDQGFSPFTLPPLTTVRVNRELLGRRAAAALLTRIAGNKPASHTIDIGFEIVGRESA